MERSLLRMYRDFPLPNSTLLDLLPSEAGCSRRQIERAFRAFGTSPASELKALRASLAAHAILWGRTRQLEDLAHELGYESGRAMRRDVRARWGLSPQELRTARRLYTEIGWWQGDVKPTTRQDPIHLKAWKRNHDKKLMLIERLRETPDRSKALIAAPSYTSRRLSDFLFARVLERNLLEGSASSVRKSKMDRGGRRRKRIIEGKRGWREQSLVLTRAHLESLRAAGVIYRKAA